MKKLISILLASSMSILLFSCSHKLTREKAKEMISQKFPIDVYSYIRIGEAWTWGSRNEVSREQMMSSILEDNQLAALYKAGIVSIAIVGYGGILNTIRYKISLTPEYSKYKAGTFTSGQPGYNYCVVKIGEKTFLNVTGIRETQNGYAAEVEYSWKLGNSTPFAGILKHYNLFNIKNGIQNFSQLHSYKYNDQQVSTGKAELIKYDDGWRLSNNFSVPSLY